MGERGAGITGSCPPAHVVSPPASSALLSSAPAQETYFQHHNENSLGSRGVSFASKARIVKPANGAGGIENCWAVPSGQRSVVVYKLYLVSATKPKKCPLTRTTRLCAVFLTLWRDPSRMLILSPLTDEGN